MKKLGFIAILLSVLSLGAKAVEVEEISTRSLLEEMMDRDHIARFPETGYTCAQFSSYDRHSVGKDQPGWFWNGDRSWFIRTEHNKGRREFVLMETFNPGAIVRFWMTFSQGLRGKGILRIYLDGQEEPVIEGTAMDVISGGLIVPAPLSTSVSEFTPYERRGHDLYFPIVYSRGCKVTYESETVNEEKPGGYKNKVDEMVYYNINYRTYPDGTKVRTFSKSDLEECKDLIDSVNGRLSTPDKEIAGIKGSKEFSAVIAPGQSYSVNINGQKAIRHIGMKVQGPDNERALRSLVLEMSFDSQKTVSAPVGDFFGVGYRLSYTSTWYNKVTDDRMMNAFWVMPFKKNCTMTLTNTSEEPIEVTDGCLEYGKWKWDASSMHFGCSWHEYKDILTGSYDDAQDLNFVTLNGKGVYVGDGVCLNNTINKWWGEGDEKVYVDGEDFPSHFGTGSEDYYGYAWCRPETIVNHPFVAQPIGEGAKKPGYVCDSRYRVLDAIPFRKSLVFDMELWQSSPATINYAPVTYWYLVP